MRSRPALLVAGLCLIAGAAYAPVAIARQIGVSRAGVTATEAVPPHAGTDGFSSDERDFTAGRSVYLRSTKTHIGRILATDEDHVFPSTFRKTHAKGVLIRHKGGPLDWQPVELLTRVYVVR
jgi:hypothetical protein